MKFSLDLLLLAHQLTAILFIVCGGIVFMVGVGMLHGDINWMNR